MPYTISATYTGYASAVLTFTGDYVLSSDATATLSGMNTTGTYTASTAVPVTKIAAGTVTLSGGAASMDFTSLTGMSADEVVTLTGLKPQIVKFRGKSTNANAITVAAGASNGLDLLGASFTLKLLAGQEAVFFLNEAAPDVASGDRILDITGTASQILEYVVIAG